MELPGKMNTLVELYYSLQAEDGRLGPDEKENLVAQLINLYKKLDRNEKRDILIPAKAEYLKDCAIGKAVLPDGSVDYYFNYRWPADEFAGPKMVCSLKLGEEYDRIGSELGRYLCPIKEDGTPESYLARAIPYYIPEKNLADSPSYHRYTVKKDYDGEPGKPVRKGIAAQAFSADPADGGGIQVVLPKFVANLKEVF